MKKQVKILHVEDDILEAELMQRLLIKGNGLRGNYDIMHVPSLKEALLTISYNHYDAVLLDLNLKDVSGIDTVAAINAESPDIPIIVLTAIEDEMTAFEAIDKGAQEYVFKSHCSTKRLHLAIHASIRRKAVERELYFRANHDMLTQLPNRSYFQRKLKVAMGRAKLRQEAISALYIDVKNFKRVNDSHGHEMGNEVLIGIGQRLQNSLDEGELISRYGSDEFVVFLSEKSKRLSCRTKELIGQIKKKFDSPFLCDSQKERVDLNIGAAISRKAQVELDTLLKYADFAMNMAGKNDVGVYIYDNL